MPPLEPMDEHNERLLNNVHPPDWQNPEPADSYNIVVVGAGTAGLVTASVAAGLGAKVALVERHFMGGDCLNVGCVPSKALIRSARAAAAARQSDELGVHVEGAVKVDFPAIVERLRKIRADISPVDSTKRFSDMGIDVFLGDAKFSGSNTVEVGGKTLPFNKAVICTGARAAVPDIPGLGDINYLTNDTLFNLTELPAKLAIIGAGPIGCEMAQTFAAFGSDVFLVESGDRIMKHDDPDAAAIVRAQLEADGVKILCGGKDLTFSEEATGIRLKIDADCEKSDEIIDKVLIATGRAPNVEGLGLEAAGVKYDERKGVDIDDQFRTSNSDIFAAGDVALKRKFTHLADFAARAVVRNALYFGRQKLSSLVVPWCTYTTPEVAHVGLTPQQAEKDGVAIDTYTKPFDDVDRALLDGETAGFVRIHTVKGGSKILGATIVAPTAGDMISQLSQAMTHGIGLGEIANVISPYPTQAEAIRKLGDEFNKEKYEGSFAMKALAKIAEWRR